VPAGLEDAVDALMILGLQRRDLQELAEDEDDVERMKQ
jgi:hypothetical protein